MIFNRSAPGVEPMNEGAHHAGIDMVAEVYSASREYGRTNRWNTPAVVRLSADDHLDGVHWRACEDCGGTRRFPMPEPDMDDFCVRCKGTGLEPVMA